MTLTAARAALRAAPGLAVKAFAGNEHWLAAEAAGRPVPRAGRGTARLLAGFDEYILGYGDRTAQLAAEHAAKVVPGANGVFRPVVVVDGQVVATWGRAVRGAALTVTLQPLADGIGDLAELVQPEVHRYRDFLGLPRGTSPTVLVEPV